MTQLSHSTIYKLDDFLLNLRNAFCKHHRSNMNIITSIGMVYACLLLHPTSKQSIIKIICIYINHKSLDCIQAKNLNTARICSKTPSASSSFLLSIERKSFYLRQGLSRHCSPNKPTHINCNAWWYNKLDRVTELAKNTYNSELFQVENASFNTISLVLNLIDYSIFSFINPLARLLCALIARLRPVYFSHNAKSAFTSYIQPLSITL